MYTLLLYISENLFTHEVVLNDTRVAEDPLSFSSAIMSFKNHFGNKKTGRLVVTILNTTDSGSIIHSHEDLRHPLKEKIIINRPAMRGVSRKPTSVLGSPVSAGEMVDSFSWATLVGQS